MAYLMCEPWEIRRRQRGLTTMPFIGLGLEGFDTHEGAKVEVAIRDMTKHADFRTQTTATWLFMLPLFTAGVTKDSAKIELAGLAVLTFATIVILRRPIPRLAIGRIYQTAAVLTLILLAYLRFQPWPSSFGTVRSYDTQAMIFVATYVEVAIFAVLFFEEKLFERVIWRAATVTLWVGVVSCVASRLTHHLLLVNPADGGLRMQGTLSEPSAWAPVIPLVVLLAMRRRSRFYVALALIGALLADSPTCILVLVLTVPLYFALTSNWRQRVPLFLVLAVVVPAAVFFVQTANPSYYLNSQNAAVVALGRLVSGVRNVETGGETGGNARFTSTRVIIAEVRANGWLHTGAGPAADDTYLRAEFPITGPTYATNALWVSVLFNFGEGGVAVLGVLVLAALWRMRHRQAMTAVLLPFFVASLVNSAEGSFEYAFVALGIMLFAFGWAAQPIARPAWPRASGSQYAVAAADPGDGA